MRARLNKIHQLTNEIYSFWFDTEKPINNVPGQYIEVSLPHNHPDSRGTKRWFTVYSSPTENQLAITTRIKTNASTFKQALLELKPNQEITYTEPMGDFVLPIDKAKPVIFVANGVGITPVRSIVKWLADSHNSSNIKILYSVRSSDDIIEHQLFDNFKAEYSVADNDKNILQELLRLNNQKPNALTYISGSPTFVANVSDTLQHNNIPKNQIVTDSFSGY